MADPHEGIDEAKSIDFLINLLEKGDRFQGLAASRALVSKGPGAVQPLLKILDNRNQYIREAAARILGELKHPDSVEGLLEFLRDTDEWVRKAAAESLGTIAAPQAVPALVVTLRDNDFRVRRAVARALGEIGDSRAVDFLIHSLADESSQVRHSVIQALGNIGDSRAVKPLLPCLKEPESTLRECAVRALGKLKDKAALPELEKRIDDSSVEVRVCLAQALGQIGAYSVITLLKQMAGDENRHVRNQAFAIIKHILPSQTVDEPEPTMAPDGEPANGNGNENKDTGTENTNSFTSIFPEQTTQPPERNTGTHAGQWELMPLESSDPVLDELSLPPSNDIPLEFAPIETAAHIMEDMAPLTDSVPLRTAPEDRFKEGENNHNNGDSRETGNGTAEDNKTKAPVK